MYIVAPAGASGSSGVLRNPDSGLMQLDVSTHADTMWMGLGQVEDDVPFRPFLCYHVYVFSVSPSSAMPRCRATETCLRTWSTKRERPVPVSLWWFADPGCK